MPEVKFVRATGGIERDLQGLPVRHLHAIQQVPSAGEGRGDGNADREGRHRHAQRIRGGAVVVGLVRPFVDVVVNVGANDDPVAAGKGGR